MNRSRLWTVVGLLVALVVLGAGYVLGVSPALASAQASATSTASVEAQNQVQTQILKDLETQAASIDETEAELEDLRTQLPPDTEYSVFIDQVSAAAAATGVLVTSVTAEDAIPFFPAAAPVAPTEPPPADQAPADPAAPAPDPATVPGSTAGLVVLPVTIAVKGTNAAVFAFVDAMRLNQRLYLLRSLSVSPLLEGDVLMAAGSLVGQIYVLETSTVDSDSASNQ